MGQAGRPYKEYFSQQLDLEPGPQIFKGVFTMQFDDDASPELAFHFGGNMAKTATVPFSVCMDDVHIEDPQFSPKATAQEAPIPNVLVNQTGYFPHLAKIATVKNPNPTKWELQGPGNAIVASGMTTAVGADPASGDQVSIADFSQVTKEGSRLHAEGGLRRQPPVRHRQRPLHQAEIPGADVFLSQPQRHRDQDAVRRRAPMGAPRGPHQRSHRTRATRRSPACPVPVARTSLDVSGGWYDAGDHGKYVVNAGISVWTLLNMWERAKHLGTSAGDFGDGKMNIPEKGNGVPDLLDEVRWELEFELKMQVPDGDKLAGMVHHKVHDKIWTALGLAPHEDPIERFLYPPSTAATLNMAANAAQAARVWHGIDKAFADKCLAAAERAWQAAQANPAILAKPGGVGGGPYDDENVSDEFYWAAAELYITTKKPVYKDFVTKVAALQAGARERDRQRRRRRRRDGPDVGQRSGTGVDLVGGGAERTWRGHRRDQEEHRGDGRRLPGDREEGRLSRPLQTGRQGLPVGIELVHLEQPDRHRSGARSDPRREVPERHRRGNGLHHGAATPWIKPT